MRKIFYCDYDGILVNSKKQLISLYNKHYKPSSDLDIDYKEAITWDCGVPIDLVEEIFKREDFFSEELEMFEGAIDGLKTLKDKGYEIILYSKGLMPNLGYKILWCDKNIKDYLDGWILTGTNTLKMIKNQYDMSVLQSDGFSILFDDCYTNLTCDSNHYLKHHMPTYSICGKLSHRKDEDWNIKFTDKKFTAYHWNELEGIINMIENYENILR